MTQRACQSLPAGACHHSHGARQSTRFVLVKQLGPILSRWPWRPDRSVTPTTTPSADLLAVSGKPPPPPPHHKTAPTRTGGQSDRKRPRSGAAVPSPAPRPPPLTAATARRVRAEPGMRRLSQREGVVASPALSLGSGAHHQPGRKPHTGPREPQISPAAGRRNAAHDITNDPVMNRERPGPITS